MTYVSKGGPRSQQGKAISSKNAIKIGVYTNTLMPGESQEELEALMEAFREQYPAGGVEVEMMIRSYAQTLLKSRRLQEAEVAFIQAQMQLYECRKEFCQQANLSPLLWDGVPDWYFSNDQDAKKEGLQVGMAFFEALALKREYSLESSLAARTQFPNLWKEVMGLHAINPKQSLGERLQVRYVMGNPHSNLQAFADDYKQRHPYEILWTQNWRRYEAILEGLRAKALLQVCARSDWLKVENLQHRRRMEISQQLQALQKLQALEVLTRSADAIAATPIAIESDTPTE